MNKSESDYLHIIWLIYQYNSASHLLLFCLGPTKPSDLNRLDIKISIIYPPVENFCHKTFMFLPLYDVDVNVNFDLI